MFNDKASEIERQKRLEDLIRKEYAVDEEAGDDETEIPNDDQVNELIARSQEEYEIFTRMDQERYVRENRDARLKEIHQHYPHVNLANVNYRLMQEWEVPEWIKAKPENKEALDEFGLGKRQRKQVNYSDEIPESQWVRIFEQGGDPQEEVERLRRKRAEQGDSGKRRKLDHYVEDEEEDDPSFPK